MSQGEPSKDSSLQSSSSNPSRKPPTSERRIQANRRNALRSTGPKTERGKRTVARNAIKHGFLAREVVITAGDGQESPEEFQDLLKRLWEDYEPVGVVEESLVQTIATCWWRKARVIRAENGEIRKRLDTLAVDLELRNSDKASMDLALLEVDLECWYSADNHADQQVSTLDRVSRRQAAQSDLLRHKLSLTHMSALLKAAKSEMARVGSLPEKIQNMVRRIFSLTDGLFTQFCLHAGPTEARMEDRPLEKVVDHQTDERLIADGVVAMINDYLERIGTLKELAARRENLELVL